MACQNPVVVGRSALCCGVVRRLDRLRFARVNARDLGPSCRSEAESRGVAQTVRFFFRRHIWLTRTVRRTSSRARESVAAAGRDHPQSVVAIRRLIVEVQAGHGAPSHGEFCRPESSTACRNRVACTTAAARWREPAGDDLHAVGAPRRAPRGRDGVRNRGIGAVRRGGPSGSRSGVTPTGGAGSPVACCAIAGHASLAHGRNKSL